MKIHYKIEKKSVKKIVYISGLILIIASLGFNFYFGWVRVKNSVYRQGFLDGQKTLNQMIVSRLQDDGKIVVNIPQKGGKTKSMTLVPQKSSAK